MPVAGYCRTTRSSAAVGAMPANCYTFLSMFPGGFTRASAVIWKTPRWWPASRACGATAGDQGPERHLWPQRYRLLHLQHDQRLARPRPASGSSFCARRQPPDRDRLQLRCRQGRRDEFPGAAAAPECGRRMAQGGIPGCRRRRSLHRHRAADRPGLRAGFQRLQRLQCTHGRHLRSQKLGGVRRPGRAGHPAIAACRGGAP